MSFTVRAIHRFACFVLACTIMVGCAVRVDPTGGERDAIPAAVTSTEPATGTASFAGDRVVFQFDDYVDRSVRNAVSVLPNVRFSTAYAGDVVKVIFEDALEPNTTYSVTLGTEWTDLRGNKPREASTVVFSTGPLIDTGRITGSIRAASLTNVVVFCYQRADTLTDRFTPRTVTPKYRLAVGSSGAFSLQGLPDGRYRVIAVRDDNRNGLLDNSEDFVVAPGDVTVTSGAAAPLSLLLGRAIDREPPTVLRLRAVSSRRVEVTFSESVRPIDSWTQALSVVRGDTPTALHIAAVLQDKDPTDRITLRLTNDLDTSRHVLLLSARGLVDSNGVRSIDSIVPTSFRGTSTSDTVRLRITSIAPADSARDVGTDSAVIITFSDAIDTTRAHATIWHEAPQGAIPVAATWRDARTMVIRPTMSRTPKTWYRTSISFDGLRSVADSVLRDTTIILSHRTEERRSEPGSIAGTVIDPTGMVADTTRLLLRLLSAKGAVVASIPVAIGAPFTADGLPAGTYGFDLFADRNGNGVYDHGDHTPFTFGESWWPSGTQVTVRARWLVEDVKVVIGANAVR
jgi:uncharacterized protein (DUF2141 family)